MLYSYSSPVYSKPSIMKPNKGASTTCIKKIYTVHLENSLQLKYGPSATLPNNTSIQASYAGALTLHQPLNSIPLIFPKLNTESLLSI